MRGRRLLLDFVRPLFRQWPQHSRITPIMTLGFARIIHGSRPSQAKSLSLGESVFSPTLHSCLCFHSVSRCLHFATVLSMLVYFRFLVFLFCVPLRKPKKIFLSSFACWELSCVNSFLFFFVSRQKILVTMFIGSCMLTCLAFKEPYYFVFSFVFACRFQLQSNARARLLLFTSFGRASERQ